VDCLTILYEQREVLAQCNAASPNARQMRKGSRSNCFRVRAMARLTDADSGRPGTLRITKSSIPTGYQWRRFNCVPPFAGSPLSSGRWPEHESSVGFGIGQKGQQAHWCTTTARDGAPPRLTKAVSEGKDSEKFIYPQVSK
jgi:hypothetical protein